MGKVLTSVWAFIKKAVLFLKKKNQKDFCSASRGWGTGAA
jgi:hypothetical protein